MVSQEQIAKEIAELGYPQLKRLDPARIAKSLDTWAKTYGISLTFYGLLRWAMDKYGGKALYENVLASDSTAKGYADAALHYRDDMPAAIVNAGNYLNALSSQLGEIELCLKQLEHMSFPYIIYVLFAGAGQQAMVPQYKGAYEEHMRRYPSTLDKLPERYRNIQETR